MIPTEKQIKDISSLPIEQAIELSCFLAKNLSEQLQTISIRIKMLEMIMVKLKSEPFPSINLPLQTIICDIDEDKEIT